MKNRIQCQFCKKLHLEGSQVLLNHSKKNPDSVKINSEFGLQFIDAEGKTKFVKDIITEKETWLLEKKGEIAKRILSHSAVQKIAKASGIKTNYLVKESDHIIPKPENSNLHVVEVTIFCAATQGSLEKGCVHDMYENTLTMTGEASKLNTGRGGNYLRTMAEKRGYDRAVLRHLGLECIYSEEEATVFENDELKQKIDVISSEDLESIAENINGFINAKTKEELENKGQEISKTIDNFNEVQIAYLRGIYQKSYSKFSQAF